MSQDRSQLELDVAGMLAEAVGREQGIDPSELAALAERLDGCRRRIEERLDTDIGFTRLPYDRELAGRVRRKAAELRSWCKNFVVLGIGGSALGSIAIQRALSHPYHNLLPAAHQARRGAPRIFVIDNVDPAWLGALLELLGDELPETAFNVITKSGSTVETMSQFLMFRDLLRAGEGCDPVRQILVTTDPRPEESLLRRIAQTEGYYALPIPADVGGRFSVLSAVGLLGAAVAGVDVDALLGGAAAMEARCHPDGPADSPAALYAAVLYLQYQRGKRITVLMPYCHALRGLADWYCQLWAESLGKRDGLREAGVFVGPTPVASVGVTDQHSVMQLYQDGPFDKVVTFIEVAEQQARPICAGEIEPDLGYLAGHSFGELLAAELAATRAAMCDKHRPNCTIRIPRLDAAALGELFVFFQWAVTYSGCLFDVNPFDQPAVELGKRYTYGLMGRQGYEPPTTGKR